MQLLKADALRRGMQPADADDLVQDTMVRGVRHGIFEKDADEFVLDVSTEYLRRIAHSQIVDHARAERQRSRRPTRRAGFDELLNNWGADQVRTAIEKMPDLLRQSLRAYVLEGTSTSDQAAREGVSVESIRQRRSRALRWLRQALEDPNH